MTSYGNSFPKRRGNYPRKSERELESFLPDNMKTGHLFSSRSTRPQDRKKQFTYSAAVDEAESKYSYSDSAKKFISRQNKENKRNGYIYEDAHGPKRGWDEGARGEFHDQEVRSTSPKPVFMKSKKVIKPFASISSETFQTAAVDTIPGMPPHASMSRSSPVSVLSRNVKKLEEKKEPVKKIQILKPTPNGGPKPTTASSASAVAAGTDPPVGVPVILSRSKPLVEKEFKILSPASKMDVGCPAYTRGRIPRMIVQKPPVFSTLDAKVVPSKAMRQPFRILDADFTLCEGYTAFNAYLLEQSNYVVVGVVGRQGVGKSSIASLLTQGTLDGRITERGYRVSGRSELLKSSHCTGGLDAYISPQRILVLDFPPVLAPGVLDSSVGSSDLGRRALELQVHSKSLEMLALALRVCHSVVVVQDSMEQGTHLLRCLQAAAVVNHHDAALNTPVIRESSEMGNPGSLSAATIMLVCNKMATTAPSPQVLRAVEVHARRHVQPGLLNISSGVGVAPGKTVNLFTLPFVPNCAKDRKALSSSAVQLRAALVGLERRVFPGHDTVPSERDWFEHVLREWEKILKSSLYLDYSRLFP